MIFTRLIPFHFRVTGNSPFLKDTDENTISAITLASTQDISQKELLHFTADCKDFICVNTLSRNPRRRMAASQCLKHKWLLGGVSGYKKSSTGEYSSPSSKRKNSSIKRKVSASGSGGKEEGDKPNASQRKQSVDRS